MLNNYYSFSVYLYAGKKKGGKSPGRTPVKSPSKRPKAKNYVTKVYCYVCARVVHNSEVDSWYVLVCMCLHACACVGVGACVCVCMRARMCVSMIVCNYVDTAALSICNIVINLAL